MSFIVRQYSKYCINTGTTATVTNQGPKQQNKSGFEKTIQGPNEDL